MGVQLSAAATDAAIVVWHSEEEVNHVENCTCLQRIHSSDFPNVLPPFLPSLTSPYVLPTNITITERSYFLNDKWFSESIIKRTADDGYVDEYQVMTKTDFKNNVTSTAYVKITPNSKKYFLLNSIRISPM